jgi:hypothetical protein
MHPPFQQSATLQVWGDASTRPAPLVIHELAVSALSRAEFRCHYTDIEIEYNRGETQVGGIRTAPTSFVKPKRLFHERVAGQKAEGLMLARILHSTQPEETKQRNDFATDESRRQRNWSMASPEGKTAVITGGGRAGGCPLCLSTPPAKSVGSLLEEMR